MFKKFRFPIFTGREMEGVFNRTMTLRSSIEHNHKKLRVTDRTFTLIN